MDCRICVITEIAPTFRVSVDTTGAPLRVHCFPSGVEARSEQEVVDDAVALEVTGPSLCPDPRLNRLKMGVFVLPRGGQGPGSVLRQLRETTVLRQANRSLGFGVTTLSHYRLAQEEGMSAMTFIAPNSHRGYWRNLSSAVYKPEELPGGQQGGKTPLFLGAVFETREQEEAEWVLRGELMRLVANI